MKVNFEPEQLALFSLIRAECTPDQKVFIVGGAVRDALLGRPIHDFDFALADNPFYLAKRVAKRLKAGFFVLDDVRHTARVAYYDVHGRFSPLDFVQFTGADLKQDLQNRDFTINTIAVSLDDLSRLIDPLKGHDDLIQGILRCASKHALVDDPIRVLRAVRLAIQFNLQFAPGLESELIKAAPCLVNTSNERQRDEFFKILEGVDPAEGLRYCKRLRIFDSILEPLVAIGPNSTLEEPAFALLDQPIETVGYFHQILANLCDFPNTHLDKWYLEDLLNEIGKYSQLVKVYFYSEITPGRTKKALAYFGTLITKIGKLGSVETNAAGGSSFENSIKFEDKAVWWIAKGFQLSNAESKWVEAFTHHHLDLLIFIGSLPDRRSIYNFFKATGDSGIALAFHLPAYLLATFGEGVDRERWQNALKVVKTILSAWEEHYETIIAPTPLIDGFDLQRLLGLKPGKKIGYLLNLLVEEQASGMVNSEDEALDFVREILDENLEKVDKDEN